MLSCKIYSCFYFLKRNSIYFSFLSYQKSIYYSVLWLSKFSLVFYKNKVLNISSLNFHNKIQLGYGYNMVSAKTNGASEQEGLSVTKME
jgi:hypothetical protein